MMIALHNPNDEQFEEQHYRRLTASASAPELAQLYKAMAELCQRKAALLQEIEEKAGPQPPVVEKE